MGTSALFQLCVLCLFALEMAFLSPADADCAIQAQAKARCRTSRNLRDIPSFLICSERQFSQRD